MKDREVILLRALKMVEALIGDDDLPDNGELSGAAVSDYVRSVISACKNSDSTEARALARLATG